MTSGSIGFAQARSILTDFDGENISLNVTRTDGSSLFLDGDLDWFSGDTLDSFWTDYEYFQDDLSKVTPYSASGGRVSGATIAVHHHDSDNSDYIAFGYWADIEIDSSPKACLNKFLQVLR